MAGQEFQKTYKDKYGMLRTEWRVLFHLGCYGQMTAKEICDRASLHKTKVSRAVAALQNRRYVARETMENDRRHEILSLTRLGQTVFDDIFQSAEIFNAHLMTTFSDQEVLIARKVLLRIANMADATTS